MLSKDLCSLRHALRQRAGGGGIYLTPQEVKVVAGILQSLADQASGLERQLVPAACRDALPPGVVDLMQRRAQRDAVVPVGLPDGAAS